MINFDALVGLVVDLVGLVVDPPGQDCQGPDPRIPANNAAPLDATCRWPTMVNSCHLALSYPDPESAGGSRARKLEMFCSKISFPLISPQ